MIEFRLLGQFALLRSGAEIDLGPARQRCVLALLLLHHDQPLPTGTLIDRVWGDRPPQRAREVLYVYMTRLRRVLQEVPVRVERQAGGYLCLVDRAAIDLHRFTELTTSAAGQADLTERARMLREALVLWHGEPLGGLTSDWVAHTRERLRQQWLSAVLACYDSELALGRHETSVTELSELVARHPLIEPLVGQLMMALHRCGRRVDALTAYRLTRQLLVREQGLEPGPALRELERAILTNDPRLDPPITTPAAAKAQPHPLPRHAGDFVGRQAELAALDGVLREPRLGPAVAVLTGASGSGKTALALHWARLRSADFPDGLHYLDMQGFSPDEPLTVDRARQLLLTSLGIGDADIPHDPARQRIALQRSLTGERLVILDNVAEASHARALMPADHRVMILAVSRKILRGLVVREEAAALTIGPLTMADAVRLLRVVGNTGDAPPGEEKLTQLAGLCDRLPLALRLVGCRLAETENRVTIDGLLTELSPEEKRLAAWEIDVGVTGVRAAFAACYRWIGDAPARLFRLMGALPGSGMTASCAAWALATTSAVAHGLLETLARHQLVHRDQHGVYRMHDLVRRYAKEKSMALDTDAERRAALRRVSSWYLDTALDACGVLNPSPARSTRHHLTHPQFEPLRFVTPEAAMAWFEVERESLAATIRAIQHRGGHEVAARLAEALLTFYHRRRLWIDWVDVFETAVLSADITGDTWIQMRIQHGLGIAYKQLGRSGEAVDAYLRALKLAQEAEDPLSTGPIHVNLSALYHTTGRPGEAKRHLQAALAVPGYGDDARHSPVLYLKLGHLSFNEKDFVQARRYLERGLSEATRGNHRPGQAYLHHGMGEVELQHMRYDCAAQHAAQALEIARSLGDPLREAYAIDLLASAVAQSDPDRARDLWAEALSLCRRLSHPLEQHIETVLGDGFPPAGEKLRRFLLERRFTVNSLQ